MEIEKMEIKNRLCDECGHYTTLEEYKDDTYCKNCGKWLN